MNPASRLRILALHEDVCRCRKCRGAYPARCPDCRQRDTAIRNIVKEPA